MLSSNYWQGDIVKIWNECKKLPNGMWLDAKTNTSFGHHFTYFRQPKEYSFLADKIGFLNNRLWGRSYIDKYFATAFDDDYIFNTERFLHNLLMKNMEGKSVMIVGAGPSALETDWQSINVDATWSCNHFFLNPILKKRTVDLFTVGNEVDIFSNEIEEYMLNHPKSTACFETTNRPIKEIKKFKDKWDGRCTWMHTRYRSQIGAIPRLILLATMMRASKVYFVGMDGLPTPKTKHAFQPGKKPLGSPTLSGAEDKFRRQFVLFWDYILNYLRFETTYVNLGEGVEGNMSAQISKTESRFERS